MNNDERPGFPDWFEPDEDGKIFGMDEDKFWAGYAELMSSTEQMEEFGLVIPSDEEFEKPDPSIDFIIELLRPELDRLESVPKVLNPKSVKLARAMYSDVCVALAGEKVSIKTDAKPGIFCGASITVSGKRFSITKDRMMPFLNAIKSASSFDFEATTSGSCEFIFGINDFWKAVETDDV